MPQYFFRITGNFLNMASALFPFKNPITSLTLRFGAISRMICRCSGITFISKISRLFQSHKRRIVLFTHVLTSPVITRYRYFGSHTTWYLHSYTVCDNFLNRAMSKPPLVNCEYIPTMGGNSWLLFRAKLNSLYAPCIARGTING